jgi:uncharacterized protein YjbJ (UPF0337 family)
MTMDQAAFEEKWKQRRSQMRVWWDKLSDNDVDQIAGRYGHLISALQAKYGFSQDQAEAEGPSGWRLSRPRPAAQKQPFETGPSRGKELKHGI